MLCAESLKSSRSRNEILESLIFKSYLNSFILSIDSTKKFKEVFPRAIPYDKHIINEAFVEAKISRVQLDNVSLMVVHERVSGCNCKGCTHGDAKRLMIYITTKFLF